MWNKSNKRNATLPYSESILRSAFIKTITNSPDKLSPTMDDCEQYVSLNLRQEHILLKGKYIRMNLSRHYTRIWSRICTYNNNNNDNNTLTYNNKLYTIILCSLHAMCQNILQQRTHAVQTVIYVYSLQTHLQERYTLCVFLGCLYMPTLSPVYCTAHIYDIYTAHEFENEKKTSLWFLWNFPNQITGLLSCFNFNSMVWVCILCLVSERMSAFDR